jgi:putative membrane protein
MRFALHLIVHILANAVGLWVAAAYVPGFRLTGTAADILTLGAILWLLNTFLKPILTFFLGPLIILTLGLLTIAINAGMLFVLDIYSPNLSIDGTVALLLATLVIAVFNIVSDLFVGRNN